MTAYLPALTLAAATVGSLHTIAPDHWVPFAALGRSNKWSTARTMRMTILCGFGHVTVSAALGVVAMFLGLQVIERLGHNLESQATWVLIAFGVAYMAWGLRRSFRAHGHHHHHHHKIPLTEWGLFLLFSSDPCVAVIPLMMAAAVNGWQNALAVVIVYELATIATMVVLVAAAAAGTKRLHFHWADRFGDALAGGVIACVGVAVAVLGW